MTTVEVLIQLWLLERFLAGVTDKGDHGFCRLEQ